MNNKGLTLLEMMIALVILGIIVPFTGRIMIDFGKMFKRSNSMLQALNEANTVNIATAPGADQRTYLTNTNTCYLLKGAFLGTTQWYVKRTDNVTVGVYKGSANCSANYIGTLTAQTNPTYDDDLTDTFWNVSGSGTTLRMLVRKLNLPK